MRRILASALIFACLLLPANGAGWLPLVKAGYTGPVNINGTAWALWSTRCGSATYSGNILDIWDSGGSTTETVLGCDGAGNIVVKSGSPLATTCSGGCRVKIIYDQSGNTNCTTACDMTQTTNANRATYNSSLLSGKGGLVFAGSQCYSAPAVSSGQAQIYTTTSVYNPTGMAIAGSIFSSVAAGYSISHHPSSNGFNIYAGGAVAQPGAANDSSTNAAQGIFNDSSSSVYVNGASSSGAGAIGTNAVTGTMLIGQDSGTACGGSDPYTGNFFEQGVWAGDKSANNSTMNSNQHTYWGF